MGFRWVDDGNDLSYLWIDDGSDLYAGYVIKDAQPTPFVACIYQTPGYDMVYRRFNTADEGKAWLFSTVVLRA